MRRVLRTLVSMMILCFTPRIHVGCDSAICCCIVVDIVSIHASTWDATYVIETSEYRVTFQSTHPRGMRPYSRYTPCGGNLFQSTHPRGMRHQFIGHNQIYLTFQSTHPRGMRQILQDRCHVLDQVSIHASTWDATSGYFISGAHNLFQSTHPRGMRLWTGCTP